LFENKTDPVFDMIFCVFHNIMKNITNNSEKNIFKKQFLSLNNLETESRTVSR
jgi:hypothetical protein